MIKYKKYNLIIFILFFLISKSYANESAKFLSLKNNEVNLRQGPSFEYPIKLTYKKKYLPVLILSKSDTWRKIQDFENNSGWIHISQLSKKKSGINKKNKTIMYEKPTIYSKPIAELELGRLVLIIKCKKQWCKTKSGNFAGWLIKENLWGLVN